MNKIKAWLLIVLLVLVALFLPRLGGVFFFGVDRISNFDNQLAVFYIFCGIVSVVCGGLSFILYKMSK